MTSTPPITRSNNTYAILAVDGGPESSYFGVHQQTTVGSGNVSIQTLVPASISAAPYRKALIVNLLFRQILALTDTPSTSFRDLMTTVAMYFP